MKVCVPTMGDKGLEDAVGEHFGRVPCYTIVDSETKEVEVLSNTSEHIGGQGYPPEIMAKAGVDVMICAGLGRRAIMMFEGMGIMVYVGASGSVEDAINMWENNNLPAATDENACQQHAFRKHDHKHDHNHD
ncbi:MAG: NifB/NifX family molybdenum-iron cluster-binding protein [Candidatus Marinimicrobia bacterium]|nr:NifB/NifX family molybdenum-iron cluster-binding protein [Candidatus Neomarinimicrobiota bacterium]